MVLDNVVRGIAHAFKVRRAPILPTSFDSPRRRRRIRHVADTASYYASRLRKTKVPEVSFVQAATYVWVFVSLVVALIGYASCSASSTRTLLHCTPTACTFERYRGTGKVPLEDVSFPRGRLLGSQSVRTRNGEVVNFEGVRRRKQRVLGHSFVIKIYTRRNDRVGDEDKEFVETSILFTKHNTGRKHARQQAAEINKYARGELDWLEIVEVKKWNALGILAVVAGLVSTVFALLLGDVFGHGNDDGKNK
ncbi:Hypothetical protein NocV09_02101100 [Nannochloropsis oceanica]